MRYDIWGNNLPAVTLTLECGESIYTQSGGMSWMTSGIEMSTNMKGGLMGGLGRLFTGESLFMATYTANNSGEQITIASTLPGQIITFDLVPGYEIIAQKGAFLCAQPGVSFSANLATGVMSGFFGGEGFILQKYSGNGLVFCEIDGSVKEYNLSPGEVIKVNTGNVAAFESSVSYNIETVRGFKNILFGGEGLFLTTLRGPGKVWLQTMTNYDLARKIIPYIPTNHNN